MKIEFEDVMMINDLTLETGTTEDQVVRVTDLIGGHIETAVRIRCIPILKFLTLLLWM